MNDQLVAFGRDEHDEFEKIGGSVGPDDEPSVWIVTEIVNQDGMVDRVEDVSVGDAVASGRGVDLHTRILYYETSRLATARCGPCVTGRHPTDLLAELATTNPDDGARLVGAVLGAATQTICPEHADLI